MQAVFMSTGTFYSIATVYLEITPKKTKERLSVKFLISRAWTVPSSILQLSLSLMALKDLSYFTTDE